MTEVSAKIETLYDDSDDEESDEEFEILKRIKSKSKKKKKKPRKSASSLLQSEQDILWAELRTDFGTFAKALPHIEMPKVNTMSSIDSAIRQHKIFAREFKISQGLTTYKMYMFVILFAIEYSLKTFFSIDFDGFAMAQWDKISEYEPILRELVAKNYASKDSNWPVEYRLAYTCGINILLFFVVKFIGSKFGPVFAKFMESFISGSKKSGEGFNFKAIINAISNKTPASREPEFDE